MFCALLTSRYQLSVYRTNGPLFFLFCFFFGGGCRVGGRVGRVGLGWGQGGCERRIEVFVKIQKKIGWGGGRVAGGGGQWGRVWVVVRVEGRCERRSEVCVKIKKIYIFFFILFFFFWGGGGVGSGGGFGGPVGGRGGQDGCGSTRLNTIIAITKYE